MKSALSALVSFVLVITLSFQVARAQYYEDVPLGVWIELAVGPGTLGRANVSLSGNVRSELWLFTLRLAVASNCNEMGSSCGREKGTEMLEIGVLAGPVFTDRFYQLSASLGLSLSSKETFIQSESGWFPSKSERRSSGVQPGLPFQLRALLKLPAKMSNLGAGITVFGNINLVQTYGAVAITFAMGAF